MAGTTAQVKAQPYATSEHEPHFFSIWVDPHTLAATTKGLGRRYTPPIKQESIDLLATKPTDESENLRWGFPNYGWRLGLRLQKAEFAVGEPVWIWALMGNLTDSNRHYTGFLISCDAWEVLLVTADNCVLESKSVQRERRSEAQNPGLAHGIKMTPPPFQLRVPVEAGRVGLHLLSLGADYDLQQPGTYYLTLSRRIPGERQGEFAQVMSATVSFRIVGEPGKPSATTTELPASSGATAPARPSIPDVPANGDLSSASATEQKATMALPTTEAAARRNRISTHAPGNEQPSDPASLKDEKGTHLGFVSSPTRIGASVCLLLVAAAVAYILLRRARRSS